MLRAKVLAGVEHIDRTNQDFRLSLWASTLALVCTWRLSDRLAK